MQYLEDEGLRLLPPSTYTTTYGKGHGCSDSDKDSVTISTQAMEFLQQDGPERLIYWNNDKDGPSEVWLSD